MDPSSLAVIIAAAACSHNPNERRAAEQSLDQFQHTPQHLIRVLQIVVDNGCDPIVRQAASIHFKNFIAKHWEPRSGDQSKILPSDKNVVRDQILVYVSQLPPILRVQMGECLKTIIYADYPEQWPHLLDWLKHNLQDQQVYVALFVLRILSSKYEEVSGVKDVIIGEGTAGEGGKLAAQAGMCRSLFCLCLAGNTPSSARLFDAIVSVCIPVIVSDELELPFEGILDYKKYDTNLVI